MGRNGTALTEARDLADKVLDQLATIAGNTEAKLAREQYRYIRGAPVAQGVTLDSDKFGPPQGWAWLVERVTATARVAAGSALEIYLDDPQPQNLVERIDLANGIAAQAPGNNIYVPIGSSLIVRFVGQLAAQQLSFNIRVREYEAESPSGVGLT